jgi:hypothetical protein
MSDVAQMKKVKTIKIHVPHKLVFKPGPGFPTLYIVVLFCVQLVKVRDG